MAENIEASIIETIKDLFGISDVKLTDHLKQDLNLDSINMVNLQVELEDYFNMQFDPINDNLAEIFKTVSSLVQYFQVDHI